MTRCDERRRGTRRRRGIRGGVLRLLALLLLLGGAEASSAQLPGPTSAADLRPVPVLLVPGWGDTALDLAPLRARFIEAGWPPGRVAYMSFDDPVGSNLDHARELAEEVRALQEATEAERVDVVAHSMGGLAVRRFLGSVGASSTGNPPVGKVVFLATPHRGTLSAYFAWGRGSEEMEPGSPFLDSLNNAPPIPPTVRALAIRTAVDLRVVPGESAELPEGRNITNLEVCCPTHPGLVDDEQTFRRIVDFLRG